MSAQGAINLAPYSFFNGVSTRPPVVMFSSEGHKDSVTNAKETGEFVCNLATWDLREQMNASSATFPHGVNEMEKTGLKAAPAVLVKPPRVAASPCALECKVTQVVKLEYLPGEAPETYVVFGQVIGIHIDEKFIKDGLLDTAAMKPIARCGYHDYSLLDETFTMVRPR
ncbi:MAG TPA: flavin reductase family protein, partial [Xanthobacteraceae bacterium]|nr:flavin reductase family protein [Xanthobacteraceae bacterium]